MPINHQPVQISGRPQKLIGQYLKEDGTPMRPSADLSMFGTTAVVAAGQSAAFTLLNIPIPNFQDQNQFQRRFQDPDNYRPDAPDGYSILNTPVYGRIVLGKDGEENKYTDAQGNAGSYQTVELDCAICSVDFNNKVVVTEIQGLPTSIKEFISNGDSDVTITGIFNSTPGVAPIDFIMALNNIFKAPVPIPVTNYYLNSLEIYYIVIMPGTSLGQTEGGYASQTFTIKAISDVPMTELLP